MLAAARIWFALSRDGLLPGWFAAVHPRYGTPHRPTLALGLFTALVAGLFLLGEVAKPGEHRCAVGLRGDLQRGAAAASAQAGPAARLPHALGAVGAIVGIAFSIWLLTELAAIT